MSAPGESNGPAGSRATIDRAAGGTCPTPSMLRCSTEKHRFSSPIRVSATLMFGRVRSLATAVSKPAGGTLPNQTVVTGQPIASLAASQRSPTKDEPSSWGDLLAHGARVAAEHPGQLRRGGSRIAGEQGEHRVEVTAGGVHTAVLAFAQRVDHRLLFGVQGVQAISPPAGSGMRSAMQERVCCELGQCANGLGGGILEGRRTSPSKSELCASPMGRGRPRGGRVDEGVRSAGPPAQP